MIFAKDAKDEAPRAVGVEVVHGKYLYKASKGELSDADRGKAVEGGNCYFASAEVIVSGGSFNTPQLLMLSGIGDAAKLDGARHRRTARRRLQRELAPVIDLPGVGRNLQDRYEVSVISEMKTDF